MQDDTGSETEVVAFECTFNRDIEAMLVSIPPKLVHILPTCLRATDRHRACAITYVTSNL